MPNSPTDARLAALAYSAQGLFPLRIPPGTKAPEAKGWPNLRLTTPELVDEAFSFKARNGERGYYRESNVGLLTGHNGLVDVDLDSPEAICIAAQMGKPDTPFKFGHWSKDQAPVITHMMYVADTDLKGRKTFSDPTVEDKKDAVILEIRGGPALQTIVPPSTHEDTGELIQFVGVLADAIPTPAKVELKTLLGWGACIASAALLARHWPPYGSWSEAEMALAGALLRAGIRPDTIEGFIKSIYLVQQPADGNDTDRGIHRFVRQTSEKLEAGDEVTGLTKLSDLIDPRVVKAVAKWMELKQDKQSNEGASFKKLDTLTKGFEYFSDDKSEAYVRLKMGETFQVHPIKSSAFRNHLKLIYREATGKLLPSDTCAGLIDIACAEATRQKRDVYVRFGWKDGAIYLDLANESWQVVKITGSGWEVEDDSPVMFRRDKAMLALPPPASGGGLEDLFSCVNAESIEARIGYVSWLLSAFHPTGTLPILCVTGVEGSAKSGSIKTLKALTDDSAVALCSKPRDERDIAISMKNSAIVGYDNLSGISEWISDAFCRVCDKAGFRTRELCTDSDEALFCERRSLIISGIDNPAGRADLASRCINVHLELMDVKETESVLKTRFEVRRSKILGALLDVVAAGIRNLESTQADANFRMADFVQWILACEPALIGVPLDANGEQWKAGTFLEFYKRNQRELTQDNLDDDAFASALIRHTRLLNTPWIATAAEVLRELTPDDIFGPNSVRLDPNWPKTAKVAGKHINRISSSLRSVGIEVSYTRTTKTRTFAFRAITRPGKPRQATFSEISSQVYSVN